MSPDKGKSRSGGTKNQPNTPVRRQRQTEPATDQAATDQAKTSWTVRPVSQQVQKQWESAAAAAPDLIDALRDRLRTRPTDRSDNPRRTGKLRGDLAQRNIAGTKLDQWQHELTGAGRVWYCPDPTTRTVWITKISLSHPKDTD